MGARSVKQHERPTGRKPASPVGAAPFKDDDPMAGADSERRARKHMSAFVAARAAAKMLGGHETFGCQVQSDADMAKAVERGFPVRAIEALKDAGLSNKDVGDLIIKARTLSHRKRRDQRLTIDESDRAARVARIIALAERTFGNPEKAHRWLRKELASVSGRRPIGLIHTGDGARIVESLLARIAWGAAA